MDTKHPPADSGKNPADSDKTNDALQEQLDDEQLNTTNPEALKEAARLGGSDAYLVGSDLEDRDAREDGDQPDGRASPMANADNPER
ncbi:hypothetical protein F4V91_15650 [Neorhizobium galegae]|uniref:Uncharacterized protein n=1 Tax=Neorhizobium galegae TaxID=399 RepID=A0A6A1TTD0_NEOGA|nr:hypothetical protein [Neorhizobium galegae]KAB1087739.1 hypothetical protein F4V91_15650 [Neorhizobium galegae]